MKKLFLIAFCVGFLSSCFFLFNDIRNPDEPDDVVIDTGVKTLAIFDNTQGKASAAVYSDNNRNNKIADVPARQLVRNIECTPGTLVPFYFSYLIKLQDIYNFSFNFTPEYGKDQIWVAVYENRENKFTIPKLEEILETSQNHLLSNDPYLLIQNDSSLPFRLQLGTSLIRPDNSSSTIVNSGEKALYKIRQVSANYELLVNADTKPVPVPPDGAYKAGLIYRYINNIDVTFDSEILFNTDIIDDTPNRFPPPDVSAAGISQTNIQITWDAVPNAIGYRVYRGSDASNYTPLYIINSPTDYMYTDTGLSPAATYYYRVSTLNSNEESEQSNAVKASTLPVPVPSGLSAAPAGSGAINISWNSVPVATAYYVYRAPVSDGNYIQITTVPSSSSYYTDNNNGSGLTAGYTFYYKVRTVMGSWESALSPYISARTLSE